MSEKQPELIDFNKKHFTKVYSTSKNSFSPMFGFEIGSQIQSNNLLHNDVNHFIYKSKFLNNKFFSLKPDFMCIGKN